MCHLTLPDKYRWEWQDERGPAEMYSAEEWSSEGEKNNA